MSEVQPLFCVVLCMTCKGITPSHLEAFISTEMNLIFWASGSWMIKATAILLEGTGQAIVTLRK
ncbi:MAG: hypothetical protein ACI8ZB_005432 [Desulforhopalus sp.]|jgi:hypothetical protein